MTAASPRPARTRAEKVTFAVSCLILGVVVALIASQLVEGSTPADPQVRRNGAVRESAGQFFVPVEVRNAGNSTAAAVQVIATLTTGDEVLDADQVIDFLAGDESERIEFVFSSDPAQGELEVRISGFMDP